jgi:hypothetical protein
MASSCVESSNCQNMHPRALSVPYRFSHYARCQSPRIPCKHFKSNEIHLNILPANSSPFHGKSLWGDGHTSRLFPHKWQGSVVESDNVSDCGGGLDRADQFDLTYADLLYNYF